MKSGENEQNKNQRRAFFCHAGRKHEDCSGVIVTVRSYQRTASFELSIYRFSNNVQWYPRDYFLNS